MQVQVIIDTETYRHLKELMGADYMVEVVDTYNTETGDLIEKLRLACSGGDAASFGRLAHSIKSSSASLGALALSQQARALEMIGKSGDLAGVGDKLERLAADFVLVKSRLEELKNEP